MQGEDLNLVTIRLSASILNLPLFAHITESEVDEVIDALTEALEAGRSPEA